MISRLQIKNFKSIRELALDCKRINVLIGQPNTGKSNILEALGIMSYAPYYRGTDAHNFVRFEQSSNLFYDQNLSESVEIRCDDIVLTFSFNNGRFDGMVKAKGQVAAQLSGQHDSLSLSALLDQSSLAAFKFYRFNLLKTFERSESDFLLPPSGANLLSLLLARRELRAMVNDLWSPYGLRLGLRPHEGRIEVIKQAEDVIISFPYSLVSETLQRMAFYLAAILTNKESVLVFEEPEAHAFPYYTKYLAEVIALDKGNNQYFMSTHNPYFLLPLIEKSLPSDIAVHVTRFHNYETQVKTLKEADVREILDQMDIFLNLDRFWEGT